jgi:hypothetical protein
MSIARKIERNQMKRFKKTLTRKQKKACNYHGFNIFFGKRKAGSR